MANIETSLYTQADDIRESASITMKNEPTEFKAAYMAGHVDNIYSYAKGLEFALQCLKPTEKQE